MVTKNWPSCYTLVHFILMLWLSDVKAAISFFLDFVYSIIK